MHSSLERGLKNVARDAQRYLQKGTWTGKSKNSVWISSIFRIMWVQFQVSFSAIYGFKRQAIIRWPINGIGKYTSVITTCHSKQLPAGLMVLSDGMVMVHFLKNENNLSLTNLYQNYLVALNMKVSEWDYSQALALR